MLQPDEGDVSILTAVLDHVAEAFDALAGDYDPDGTHAHIARVLVDFLDLHAAPNLVIDAAAGTGAAAFAAVKAWTPLHVLAVDVSQRMLAAGQHLARTLDPHRHVAWVHGSALPLPIADGAADVVLCASSLHFLGASAFADWSRALRHGGALGFTLPTASSFHPSPTFLNLMPADAVDLPNNVEDAITLTAAAGFTNVRAALVEVGGLQHSRQVAVVAARRP